MRDKFGLSTPRNSGFDCGSLSLENQGLSVCKEFLVDGGWEGQDGSSASSRGVAGFSAGWGRGFVSLMRTCSIRGGGLKGRGS